MRQLYSTKIRFMNLPKMGIKNDGSPSLIPPVLSLHILLRSGMVTKRKEKFNILPMKAISDVALMIIQMQIQIRIRRQ